MMGAWIEGRDIHARSRSEAWRSEEMGSLLPLAVIFPPKKEPADIAMTPRIDEKITRTEVEDQLRVNSVQDGCDHGCE